MDLMDFAEGRAKVLCEGVWGERDISVTTDEVFRIDVSREMEAAATARFLTRKEANPALFAGEARYLSWEHSTVTPRDLALCFGPSTYPLSDICYDTFCEAFGWSMENMPLGTGSTAIVITRDWKIAMDRRSKKADFSYKFALIGGILDEDSPHSHIRREIKEELGVESSHIRYIQLFGILEGLEGRYARELSFFMPLSLSSDEVVVTRRGAFDADGELFFLNCEPRAVRRFITKNHQVLPPGNIIALVLAGRQLWGKQWSEI